MLRFLVLVLVLANAGFYAWSQGLLRSWGLAPQEQSEPQRLAQQIRPEALRLLGTPNPAVPPAAAPAAASVAAAPVAPTLTTAAVPAVRGECLQAGVLEEAQAEAWRKAASALPPGSWNLERNPIAGRWMVYMGPFADADALAKKRTELRTREVSFDRPGSALEPGLSLGRFSTEEAAQRGLANLNNKGVRTARVVVERPEAMGYTLRLPLVDAPLRAQLAKLEPILAGKPLRSCF